jgi:uncharacterized protein
VILFCDTSALMKAYAKEEHSEKVRQSLEQATSCIVSLITWAEMCAAFGVKERTQQITKAEVAAGLKRLNKEWGSFGLIGVDSPLMMEAGELALRFGLRAYDSVQLASAERVHKQLGSKLIFCCFDKQLNSAADALSINLLAQ